MTFEVHGFAHPWTDSSRFSQVLSDSKCRVSPENDIVPTNVVVVVLVLEDDVDPAAAVGGARVEAKFVR